MKDIFGNFKNKMNEMLDDENSILSKTKNKLKDQQVSIPISADLLLIVFKKQEFEGISNIDISLTDKTIVISGVAKKMLMTINFSIEFKPVRANDRKLSFEIISLKPLNQDWIKKIIFNRPPAISYNGGDVTIDLNQIEKIKSIPVGTIKDFEVKDKKLWISLGV